MIKEILILDIFRLGDRLGKSDNYTYRFVTRSPKTNEYCLISFGTGEVVVSGNAKRIIDYVNGDNPLKHPFEYYANLNDIIKENDLLPSFKNSNFAKIRI